MAMVPKAKIGQWNENMKQIMVGCRHLCPSSLPVIVISSLCIHPDISFSPFPQQLSPSESGIPTDQNYPILILIAIRPVRLQSENEGSCVPHLCWQYQSVTFTVDLLLLSHPWPAKVEFLGYKYLSGECKERLVPSCWYLPSQETFTLYHSRDVFYHLWF